jgi:release factor glutamine methyltransferase
MNAALRLSESEILRFHFALKKLKEGVPIQYVLGTAWFYGDAYTVSPAVLIPRPETEELVQLIVDRQKSVPHRLLDVGTGSGCIPLALKKVFPQTVISACDVSPEALAVAQINAHQLQREIDWQWVDILTQLPNGGPWNGVISNPPYVLESDKKTMAEHVLNHEPSLALFIPDNDPLLFYKKLWENQSTLLQDDGFFAFEIHEAQAEAMLQLTQGQGEIVQDMQGKNRFFYYKKIN